MRFKLRDEEAAPRLLFFLTESDGAISLCVQKHEGETWDVCWISSDGEMTLATGIPDNLGLKVTVDGEIRIF